MLRLVDKLFHVSTIFMFVWLMLLINKIKLKKKTQNIVYKHGKIGDEVKLTTSSGAIATRMLIISLL